MSRESVQAFLEIHAPDIEPVVLSDSTATVAEAARALGVEEGQIAKTLALKVGEERILVVMAGTGRLDNRKTKDTFGNRPRMLPAEEVLELTSHQVGGVCPFGLPHPVRVFCDASLRAFDEVWPAAGDRNSSVCLTPDRLAELVGAQWVDVSRL
ncbi:YbaK/EbsC family protein [Gluconacetobacter entanii]|uniref:YbaK/EbsC family protein n=1 Tax=Gluconacetobacter entanii TaxID=108528 RepID=A0ABT3K2R1_9PROT|nr:YbaK/EbsC family protein [Gluconacetobacter entanii]MCW4589697.1 YbaK/EbsC family protein [Gluconacetobacter entanii]MCW4593520.1 YbaK/EbsC family protein [Gluconacetobacter entanii]NPC90418.1 YbaK/EbsC family protein [Gluconacetobacter entanii]